MENHLSAYQSYRMKQMRTSRKIIEENSEPEQIPPPPPCRLMMRIRKQDSTNKISAVKNEKKEVNGKNTQMPTNIKLKVPQYGVQLVQQGIVKTIPFMSGQTVSNVATVVKSSASFAQLVQTSTGKHLLLTPNPSISGNIPVTATTSGESFQLEKKNEVYPF